ncbi:MAG: hypothetical protein E7540_02705 [Ruminococcaceae bacterium]|nr:hypothetical protein [Oscillospiraceae bacterium]
MREDICTIPISEAFEENDGCPICRMYETVEERIIEYIMGAAMMEPDIRIETNRLGFCEKHLSKMYSRRGKLQLALMLETHTKELHRSVFKKATLSPKFKKAEKAEAKRCTCFVCEKIDWGFKRMTDTIYRTYETDRDFRELFESQDMFCLEHYSMLTSGCAKKMKRYGFEFTSVLEEKTGNYLESLSADLKKYCSMFDYRNSGADADWGNSKDSIERTIEFLTGHRL